MALRPCPECKKAVSTEADKCPHCGYPMTLARTVEPDRAAAPIVPDVDRRPRLGERLEAALLTGLAWFFGVLLIMGGLAFMMPPGARPLGGILFAIAGLILLPITRSRIHSITGVRVAPRFTAGAVAILIVASTIESSMAEQRSSAQSALAADSLRLANLRSRFDTGATTILASMRSAIDSANYRSAIAAGEPYRFIGDERLDSLYRLASARQRAKINQAREQQILAALRDVPATDPEQNRRLYEQLVAIDPANSRYRERFNHYNERIREQEREDAERRRRFGDPPQQRQWDGTYREVTDYLRRALNDPESLKMDGCTTVYHVAEGWLVGCDYRGRNAFGGMVRESKWFIIRQGMVINIKPASAYRR